jgi:hypothetical protein
VEAGQPRSFAVRAERETFFAPSIPTNIAIQVKLNCAAEFGSSLSLMATHGTLPEDRLARNRVVAIVPTLYRGGRYVKDACTERTHAPQMG